MRPNYIRSAYFFWEYKILLSITTKRIRYVGCATPEASSNFDETAENELPLGSYIVIEQAAFLSYYYLSESRKNLEGKRAKSGFGSSVRLAKNRTFIWLYTVSKI